jgi:hypothetical protein
MATQEKPAAKVDYSLLERFTELLICSGCFKKHVRQPVRQLVSGRHRPLALCSDCASKRQDSCRAPIVRLRQNFHY